MRLTTTTLSLLALAPAAASAAEERTYTDDLGIVHTTTKDKPTIVTFAHTAVSAFDYGEQFFGGQVARLRPRLTKAVGRKQTNNWKINGRAAKMNRKYHVLSDS